MNNNTDIELNRLKSLFISGNYRKVLEVIESKIATDPQNAELLNLAGLCCHYIGKGKESKEFFERALKLKPKDAILRGNILGNLTMYEAALRCYDKAIELHPDDSKPLVYKAISLMRLKKYTEAVTCCDRAIELNPYDSDAWSAKGSSMTFLKKKDYLAALACFNKALDINPNHNIAKINKRGIQTYAAKLGIKLCWRCNQRTNEVFEPISYWQIDGFLCKECYELALENTKVYDAKYFEVNKTANSPKLTVAGKLMIHTLDRRSRIVFEPIDKTLEPVVLEDIIKCSVEEARGNDGEESDRLQEFLRIDFIMDENNESAFFDLGEYLETVQKAITSIIPKMLEEKTVISGRAHSLSIFQYSSEEPSVKISTNELSSTIQKDELVCKSCKAVVNKSDIKFGLHVCPYCGNKVMHNNNELKTIEKVVISPELVVCISCKFINPKGSKFCNSCGFNLRLICSNCENPNPPKSKYCNQCGSELQ